MFISKVPIQKSIQTSLKTRTGCAGFSSSFPFRGHRQPLHAGDTRLDPRGRRAWLLSLHAYGAAFDNPDLIVTVMVGDGESETGPLATGWHCNKFLNPARDGAVLPILHLNGYKIANPTILARIPHQELEFLFRGYGYEPYFVEGSDLDSMHQAMAATLEHCILEIRRIQNGSPADRGNPAAPTLAHDCSADPERVDRSQRG